MKYFANNTEVAIWAGLVMNIRGAENIAVQTNHKTKPFLVPNRFWISQKLVVPRNSDKVHTSVLM